MNGKGSEGKLGEEERRDTWKDRGEKDDDVGKEGGEEL